MTLRSHPASATITLCALALCGAWLTHPLQAHSQAQQNQAQQNQIQQNQAQPGQAGQSTREQGAATQRQTRKTEGANRAAAVEDETSTAAQAARTSQAETAQFEAAQARRSGSAGTPSYGPTLVPRGRQAQDSVRKDPAEVHDETDSLTRPAPARQERPADSQRQTANPNLRRPAWQPATEPMAPRPLRSASGVADPTTADPGAVPVPIPAPAAPLPAPASRPAIIGSCQGNSCIDTSGKRYNGIGTGAAGVNSSGRLCTRSGVSVQCF